MALWGIDLGGTKIEGVVLPDAHSAEPLCRIRIDTGAEQGYEPILENIVSLVDSMSAETGLQPSALGIGTPGIADPATGTMKNSNTTCLIGEPLRDDLQAALGVDVLMANDANCFALAEALYGAAKGAHSVFGVIMGTGVGGGIVIEGKVVNGAQGIAGEWGHNILEPDGAPCYCGKRGCVETVISGPSLERFYFEKSKNKLTLKEIARLARGGEDRAAKATIERLTDSFGRALAGVVNILDPEVIVLGGGVGNIDELYTSGVRSLEKHVFNDSMATKVVRPKLGDSAGVFGAALLTVTD